MRNTLSNTTPRAFNEILYLQLILNQNYKYVSSIDMSTLLKILPRFLSDEALCIVERIAKITNNPLDLVRKLHDVYAMKPKHYRMIHLITAASSNDDEKHTMHATIRETYSEATIIDIQDPAIIGGCIIEIDGVKQFDSSCRLELSNLICKIKDRLGKRN